MKVFKFFILVDGIVDHSLAEPIYVYDVMLENVKVESSVKIAIVLKDLDIDVPDKIGSD